MDMEKRDKIDIRPRKRLGRIRRGARLGIIKSIRGDKVARESEGEA